jgi:hypothetical protein
MEKGIKIHFSLAGVPWVIYLYWGSRNLELA